MILNNSSLIEETKINFLDFIFKDFINTNESIFAKYGDEKLINEFKENYKKNMLSNKDFSNAVDHTSILFFQLNSFFDDIFNFRYEIIDNNISKNLNPNVIVLNDCFYAFDNKKGLFAGLSLKKDEFELKLKSTNSLHNGINEYNLGCLITGGIWSSEDTAHDYATTLLDTFIYQKKSLTSLSLSMVKELFDISLKIKSNGLSITDYIPKGKNNIKVIIKNLNDNLDVIKLHSDIDLKENLNNVENIIRTNNRVFKNIKP